MRKAIHGPAGRCLGIWGMAIFLLLLVMAAVPAGAIGIWGEGWVTQAPWHDEYERIAIDDKQYTIMPNSPIRHRTQSMDGQINETYEGTINLGRGEFVLFKAEGRRIYEIIRTDRSLK